MSELLASSTTHAISIRQPWAWLIANGLKDIENRDWVTKFRGPVLIHASSWWSRRQVAEDFEFARRLAPQIDATEVVFDLGGYIGVVSIDDCVSQSRSRWFFGRYGFVMSGAKPIPFVAAKGKPGIYRVAG